MNAVLDQVWDANHQLLAQTITGHGGHRMQQRGYEYRNDGLLTSITDQLGGSRTFDLDPRGRVTAVRASGWTEKYAYDTAGNLTRAGWPAPPASLEADSRGHRTYGGTLVRRAGYVRYEHDAQGRVVLRQRKRRSRKPDTWRYFWDADDRMTGVLTPDGTRWHYRYDPLGRRVAKQRLSGGDRVVEQVDFVWDGTVLAEQAESDGQSNGPWLGDVRVTVWDYEPGTFRPVTQHHRSPLRDAPRQWVDERFYAIVTDLVGAPSELVDDEGGLAWHRRASLWGNILGHRGTGATTPLRFPGQYHDPETGFDYNYFRHYDPTTGRYASPDPLGLDAGPNPHSYVPNPWTAIDPLGLMGCEPKRTYDDSEYGKHGQQSRQTSRGVSSPAPTDGQAALERSFNPKPGNPDAFRRYGVDYANNEIVVIDRHRAIPGSDGRIVEEVYHGHVPNPSELSPQVINRMKRMGWIDKKFNILPPS